MNELLVHSIVIVVAALIAGAGVLVARRFVLSPIDTRVTAEQEFFTINWRKRRPRYKRKFRQPTRRPSGLLNCFVMKVRPKNLRQSKHLSTRSGAIAIAPLFLGADARQS